MNRVYFMFTIGILLAVLLSPAHVFGKQFLVKDGHSDYVIVEANDAIPAEVTAAEELKTYLKQMTGADLEIIKEDKYVSGPMIAVGFNSKLPDALKAQTFGSLGEEELIIKSDKDTLLLAGGRPRGSLYAVYEFLHNQGVRWYTPAYTKLPSLRNIQLAAENYRYNPPIRGRSQIAGNGPTEAWSAANRVNRWQLWSALDEKYGGGYGQGPDMHTFGRMINVNVLRANPSWMAMVNGERKLPVGDIWSLCLSNVDVRQYLISRTLEWARKNPDRGDIWIAQNDGYDYCTCSQCQAFYDAHGGQPSSLIVQLLNELSAAVASEPGLARRAVKTLAYAWSLTPPTGMQVSDNAIIMFCAGGDVFSPIETDPGKAILRQHFAGWKKIAHNFEIYLYSPVDSYWFAYPTLYSACENIKWASNNGINNIYIQVSGYGGSYGSDLVELRAWVYARLTWNPQLNIQDLIEDFANGYYGPAGKDVLTAIRMTNSNVLDPNGKVISFNKSEIVPNCINPKTVRTVNRLFEKRYNKLSDPVYKSRLSFAWIPYLWSDFWLGYSTAGSYNPTSSTWMVPLEDSADRVCYAKKVKQFMIDHNVTSMGERTALNPHNLAIDKVGIPWPANRLVDGNVEAVVVPGVAGQIFDFKDTSLNFVPLKRYWGVEKAAYPLYSSWRDFVNLAYSTEYTVKKNEPNNVVLETTIGDFAVSKTITMCDKTLQTSLVAKANKDSSAQLRVTSMFDLTAKMFGDYPTLYVEKTDGTWSKRVMGSETNFWYASGVIDIGDTTGRMVLAAQSRPEGVLLTFSSAEVSSVSYQYDRYDGWPSDQGHMLQLSPTSPTVNLQAGQTIKMDYSLKILPDVNLLVKLP